MNSLPDGTVTFLFTDIEGSTRLLQEQGDAYAGTLAQHRLVFKNAIEQHGGVVVDTQGDAFFVAFQRASDAVAAAEEAQRKLELPVRMGIHTGEPALADEGYVGLDVHRAARICAAGHGGQVVVSESTQRLLEGQSLRDLGEHRLKDLGQPVRLYQLGDEEFPPLHSPNQPNLPAQPSPLVGSERELAELLLLGAVYQLFSSGLRTGAGAEAYSNAVLLAESGIDVLSVTALKEGDTSDRIGIYERRTHVRIRPDIMPEIRSVLVPFEIEVQVSWRQGVSERSVSLSTLHLGRRPDLPP